jgi:hypothetical protein
VRPVDEARFSLNGSEKMEELEMCHSTKKSFTRGLPTTRLFISEEPPWISPNQPLRLSSAMYIKRSSLQRLIHPNK